VHDSLKRVQMSHRANHYPSQPSENSEAVMDLLSELHQSGATICMVTHDSRYADHADRVIYLLDGRVVEHAVSAT
jgi:ABC-type lipoprotein export system ATPase subunit